MDDDRRPDANPEPVTARSLGMFNVIVGILGILAASYEAGAVAALPAFGTLMKWGQDQQQAQADAAHRARLERFDERLQEATSDEQRARIEAERALAELDPARPPSWTGFSMGFLDHPRIRLGAFAMFGVMTALNGLLIASGIGLVKFRAWGRATAMIAASLLIPAAVAFSVASVMAAPLIAERWTAEMAATLFPDGDGGSLPADTSAAIDAYEAGMSRLFATSIASSSLIGLFYPVAALVVASRPGVRAATTRRRPSP